MLGQESDQSSNLFSIGEKIIVAVLPHERTDKLMAKWKGPFTVTKIPNRFQIEYLDDGITRLTHISYAKKFNEWCQNFAREGMSREQRVSRVKPWVKMARIWLIHGKGRHPKRMVVPSVKAISERWSIFSGRIRIQVLGDGALPSGLQAIVDAAGERSWIEGENLVDLCKQRSEEGGSGCNAPGAFEEPLTALATGCDSPAEAEEPSVPLAPPQEAPVMPVVQVRRYSWRSYDKHVAYDKRREFVGRNRQINTNSLLFSPQEPLVSRVHLMQVVRKIGQQERSRGRSLTVDKFNAHCSKGGKNVTSSSHSNQENGGDMTVTNSGNIGISKSSYKYPGINDEYNSKITGKQERGREEKLRLPGPHNGKGMVTLWIHDVTIGEQHRKPSLDKLVARQYKQTQVCYGKVVQGYNKMKAIIAFYFIILTQILKGFTHSMLCELKAPLATQERSRRTKECDAVSWISFILFSSVSIIYGNISIDYGFY